MKRTPIVVLAGNLPMKALILMVMTITASIIAPGVNAQQQQQQGATAIVFGATGAVGSEVLRSLLHYNDNEDVKFRWENIILIGRNFPPEKMYPIIGNEHASKNNKITKITIPNLKDIDQDQQLIEQVHSILTTNNKINDNDNDEEDDGETTTEATPPSSSSGAAACFINVGFADISKSTLQYWHSIEVEMMESITKFCSHPQIAVQYTNVLSAVDAEENPKPFSREEISEVDGSNSELGWIKAISIYMRIKGLQEATIIRYSKSSQYIQLFQPNTIVTPTTRYGWIDYLLFKIHPWLDKIIGSKSKYHSVPVQLLGMAMVKDAIQCLSKAATNDDVISSNKRVVTRLTYDDYIRLAGDDFNRLLQKKQQQQQGDNGNDDAEL